MFTLGSRYEPGRSVTACDVAMITDTSNIVIVLLMMIMTAISRRISLREKILFNILVLTVFTLFFLIGYVTNQ